ncbi:DNase I-like protein, partial [Trametes versicolor FP-101664 SS1]|uniref:DNase I-like protein n=1 Tax=Trametes versicolor (strain FP-101664) TaxID=717944 RepID=UPI0004622032
MLINQLVRDEKIGLLALQETHLTSECVDQLNELFGRHLRIYHSELTHHATGAGGVALAVNKRLIDPEKCVVTDIQKGRAMAISFPWSTGRELSVVNVYGPNSSAENAVFWRDVKTHCPASVDILLGDFNVVEDGIDRIPVRAETGNALQALQELLAELRLEDGWRMQNPHTKAFTYMQKSTGSQSRLDRIYVASALHQDADEWRIKESGLPTDHKLTLVSLANRSALFMGKGRWSMPAHLLTDTTMIAKMRELGRKLVEEIAGCGERTAEKNPQIFYQDFKLALTKAARDRAKAKVPKLQKRLENLRNDLERTLNEP